MSVSKMEYNGKHWKVIVYQISLLFTYQTSLANSDCNSNFNRIKMEFCKCTNQNHLTHTANISNTPNTLAVQIIHRPIFIRHIYNKYEFYQKLQIV